VLTTLAALGLQDELASRDLGAVRAWYSSQDGEKFNEKALRLAKLKYVVSSHSPFFHPSHLAACLAPPPLPPRYRTALEVDSLLEGEWSRVRSAALAAAEPLTISGIASLLRRCVSSLRPEYLSASTPHDFEYTPASSGSDVHAPLERLPSPSAILELLLLPLCLEADIPLLLRMGTRRGLNPGEARAEPAGAKPRSCRRRRGKGPPLCSRRLVRPQPKGQVRRCRARRL